MPLKRYQPGDEVSLLNLKARKQRMDAIRRHINNFIATEEQLLEHRFSNKTQGWKTRFLGHFNHHFLLAPKKNSSFSS
ncbi:hypothetical protein [Nostoc flagelliforme]|uniref:hypothetical protein n=1 Tax=Nostoc flagelliforme TaxID=1306274 RepID=UPI00142D23CF|nr:hypothetical protein [Nostoc flagelliforme]